MIDRITKRADFVAAAKGRRFRTPRLTLQARPRDGAEVAGCRVGFTVTRREGGAVARNRIKRRLRAAIDRIARDATSPLPPASDIVVIGRRDVLNAGFADLVHDIAQGIEATCRAPARGAQHRPHPSSRPPVGAG